MLNLLSTRKICAYKSGNKQKKLTAFEFQCKDSSFHEMPISIALMLQL